MLSLQKRGVIGIAPYAFFNTTPTTGITNPLNCTDCALGRNEQRMRAWFGGCQVYTNVTRATGSVSGGQTQIVFGNESGTVCNQNTQMDYFRGLSFTGRDIMQPQSAQLRSSVPRFFSCDACLMANASRSFTNMFSGLNANNPQFGASDRVCKSFPEIEQWSSARNLDPMLVRAFVYTESNFEPCAAAKVCSRECIRDHCTDGCFPAGDFAGNSECYAKPAYDEMYDPAGTCAFAIASNSGQARPDWRYCAFGLMQSIEPPYTFWPAQYRPDGQDGPYFDVFDRSGFRTTAEIGTARGCNPNFNPFLPADSVCIGTAKIESALRAAKAWINSHRPQLNWDTTANGDFDKTNLFAAYVAGNMYAGFWGSTARRGDHPCPSGMTNGDCWAYRFAQSWAVNATYCASSDGASDSRCEGGAPKWHPPFDCYGETDWMRYVQECELPFLPRAADPGRTKIEAYIQLAKGCSDYMCPDGKVLFTAMERPLPASGTPYLPDSTTPGGGTGTGSGGTGTGG
jgi:hypothetical protein